MEPKEFQVEMVCRQRTIYRVEAHDAEAARRIATERWQRSEPSDVVGFGWRELRSVTVAEAPGKNRERQDDEVILRFIRERERLLLRLADPAMNASLNDAVSAAQAAMDLGWRRPATGYDPAIADTIRAAQALERLCARKRLMCFDRPRERAGERGEIRLYCTPEYLELLSDASNPGAR